MINVWRYAGRVTINKTYQQSSQVFWLVYLQKHIKRRCFCFLNCSFFAFLSFSNPADLSSLIALLTFFLFISVGSFVKLFTVKFSAGFIDIIVKSVITTAPPSFRLRSSKILFLFQLDFFVELVLYMFFLCKCFDKFFNRVVFLM